MESSTYRKASLDRLASPDQLDQLMTITRPAGWLAVAVLWVMLAVALMWAVTGRIPEKVSGRGILIRAGGIFEVVALGSGQLQEILVRPDQQIAQGQVVARLRQPELELQLQEAQQHLAEVQKNQGELAALDRRSRTMSLALLDANDAHVQAKVRNLTLQRQSLQDRIAAGEKRVQDDLQQLQQQLTAIETELAAAQDRSKENQLKRVDVTRQREQSDISRTQLVEEALETVRGLQEMLDQTSLIRATLSGIIVDLRAELGLLVSPGTSIATVELQNAPILAVVYIDAGDGKKVQPGMPIQISPSTVKKEVDGVLLGTVETVSSFPASSESMMVLLHNEELVHQLSAQGPPIAVFARLLRDPKTPSGFRWSSGEGPKMRITAGTPCTASVVIEEQPPIALVIPALKEKLGL